MSDNVSEQVVQQRVRNRMIEYWETLADAEAQLEYQERVPFISVSAELIARWKDWQVYDSPQGHYGSPVFTPIEHAMVEKFERVWSEIADSTPDPIPEIEELLHNHLWKQLMGAAREARDLFAVRGRLDEQNEM